jgi:hypothetical protein
MFDPTMNAILHRSLRQFRDQLEEHKPVRLLEPAGEAKSEFNLLAWFSNKPTKRNGKPVRQIKLNRLPE